MNNNNIATAIVTSKTGDQTTSVCTIIGTITRDSFILKDIIDDGRLHIRTSKLDDPRYNIPNPSIRVFNGDYTLEFNGEAADRFLDELFTRGEVNVRKLADDIINNVVSNSTVKKDSTLGHIMIYGESQPSKTYGDKSSNLPQLKAINRERSCTLTSTNTVFDPSVLSVLPHNINTENSRGKRASLTIYDDAFVQDGDNTCPICSICNKPIDSCSDIFVFDDGDYLCRSCYDDFTDNILGETIIAGEKEYVRLKEEVERGASNSTSNSLRLYGEICVIDHVLEKLKAIEYLSELPQEDIDFIIETFNMDIFLQAALFETHNITRIPYKTDKTPKENHDDAGATNVAEAMKNTPNVDDFENDVNSKKSDNEVSETNVATILLDALEKIYTLDGTPINDVRKALDELKSSTVNREVLNSYDSLYKIINSISYYYNSKLALKAVANKLGAIKDIDNDLTELNKTKGE